jgi:hypothetical protein
VALPDLIGFPHQNQDEHRRRINGSRLDTPLALDRLDSKIWLVRGDKELAVALRL